MVEIRYVIQKGVYYTAIPASFVANGKVNVPIPRLILTKVVNPSQSLAGFITIES